jgi:hypothetical protein
MRKKALLTLFLPTLVLFIFVLRPEVKASIPFSLEAIRPQSYSFPEWVCRNLNEEEGSQVSEALAQSYKYLGAGGQCYAFVSEDDKYVIKFFKQKAFAIPAWIERFPIPLLMGWIKEAKMKKRLEHRNKVFAAFRLSLDHLSQETGLLYAHLNRTTHLNKELSFCDANGLCHLLNLDDLEFVIQKKAEMAFARIDALMLSGDIAGASEAIAKLLQLNVDLCQKGYRNRDPNFRSNCGFIGNQAVLVDVGRIVPSEDVKKPDAMKKELGKAIPRFQEYLSAKHPELLAFFEDCVQNIVPSDAHE